MNILNVVDCTLSQVVFYLERLDGEKYKRPLEVFSYSSLGKHTRHIIEFFECLVAQAPGGRVNYDLRDRNVRVEEDPDAAIEAIQYLLDKISRADLEKPLILEHGYDTEGTITVSVNTTFERELIYNVEHAIHHMAMVKIGLRILTPEMELPDAFGIAPSTIRHQMQKTRTSS